MTRDSLAKALYCRTVATIVRRANSLKRLGSTSGTLSSDSNESVHNQAEVASQHASTVGTAGSKSSKSMQVLNNAVRHATDGFIGILDMFGFDDPKVCKISYVNLKNEKSKVENKLKKRLKKYFANIFSCKWCFYSLKLFNHA